MWLPGASGGLDVRGIWGQSEGLGVRDTGDSGSGTSRCRTTSKTLRDGGWKIIFNGFLAFLEI